MNRSNRGRSRFARALLLILLIFTAFPGCTTSPFRFEDRFKGTSNEQCYLLMKRAPWADEVALLGTTQELYEEQCWREVLRLGKLLRGALRDKHYSISGELGSLFFPEQETQTYVLESHERVYLTLLIAMSSLKNGDREGAEIELRRANDEMNAQLYNYGQDRMNSVLMAAMWEELGHADLAEPYWRRVDMTPAPKGKKQVFGVGVLGDYRWSLEGEKGTLYRIRPRHALPEACHSKTGVVVPADDWSAKMSLRHSREYHPLLNLKTWVRVPVGVVTSAAVGISGALLAVGGCGAVFVVAAKSNAQNGEGLGEVCGAFVKAGGAVMEEAPGVFDAMAQPDLRHWPKTPAALLVTSAPSMDEEDCVFESVGNRRTKRLF